MRTIRELREERGWTQADLASKIDVAPSTIYNWERGKFEPRLAQLRQVASVFGIRIDEIELIEPAEGKAVPVAA
jgi:putative transcriptional regulator